MPELRPVLYRVHSEQTVSRTHPQHVVEWQQRRYPVLVQRTVVFLQNIRKASSTNRQCAGHFGLNSEAFPADYIGNEAIV